jgi:hypothetical protein
VRADARLYARLLRLHPLCVTQASLLILAPTVSSFLRTPAFCWSRSTFRSSLSLSISLLASFLPSLSIERLMNHTGGALREDTFAGAVFLRNEHQLLRCVNEYLCPNFTANFCLIADAQTYCRCRRICSGPRQSYPNFMDSRVNMRQLVLNHDNYGFTLACEVATCASLTPSAYYMKNFEKLPKPMPNIHYPYPYLGLPWIALDYLPLRLRHFYSLAPLALAYATNASGKEEKSLGQKVSTR